MDEVAEAYHHQKRIFAAYPDYGSVPVSPQEVEDVDFPNSRVLLRDFRFSWSMAAMTFGQRRLTTYDRKAYASMDFFINFCNTKT